MDRRRGISSSDACGERTRDFYLYSARTRASSFVRPRTHGSACEDRHAPVARRSSRRIGWIGYESHVRSEPTARGHSPTSAADFLPTVAQHIRSFRRSRWRRDGRSGDHGGGMPSTSTSRTRSSFASPDHLLPRRRRAARARSRGPRAVSCSRRELRTFTLARRRDRPARPTSRSNGRGHLRRARDLITSPGPVRMRGRTLDVSGAAWRSRSTPQHVRLLEDVHTTLRSDAAPSVRR